MQDTLDSLSRRLGSTPVSRVEWRVQGLDYAHWHLRHQQTAVLQPSFLSELTDGVAAVIYYPHFRLSTALQDNLGPATLTYTCPQVSCEVLLS